MCTIILWRSVARSIFRLHCLRLPMGGSQNNGGVLQVRGYGVMDDVDGYWRGSDSVEELTLGIVFKVLDQDMLDG